MIFQKIELDIGAKQAAALKAAFEKVVDFLEQGGSLNLKVLADIAERLSAEAAKNKALVRLLEALHSGGDFYHVNLCHPDADILNLPWALAADPVAQNQDRLCDLDRLFISKNPLKREPEPRPPGSGPLKILVMISSPKDLKTEGRLDYEEEERQILRAFEPLFRQGEIQVDFCDDGSLEALRRKIKANDYHILHFSGHGSFDPKTGKGHLMLEDPLDLKHQICGAAKFAEALLKPGHTIPLVVLSSCQTARARYERGLAGVTAALRQKGIPAVVAMGLSIEDRYATAFSARFYRSLANKDSISEAFAAARSAIKEQEAEDILKVNRRTVPLQWLIPHLYLGRPVEVVDWQQPFVPLKPEARGILFENTTMEKSGLETDQFVGRREDLARILPVFSARRPVLLKGQGGIGKTTLARKLIQRLEAAGSDLVPFIYNEEGKEFTLSAVRDQLKRFCLEKGHGDWITELKLLEGTVDQEIGYLLDKAADRYRLLLLFDNLESFQEDGDSFSVHHAATLRVIRGAVHNPRIYTLLTGRYPVPELADRLSVFDLNDIDQNDFIRKCYNLGLTALTQPQMESLYRSLGGNFRLLEFFHRALCRDQALDTTAVNGVFKDLAAFKQGTEKYTEEAQQKMAENLVFDRLWQRAEPEDKKLASLLAHFSLPVTDMAFHLQGCTDHHPCLRRLQQLTLIQVYLERSTDLTYTFMPPLVKTLLRRQGTVTPMPKEFHDRAGRYHYYMFTSIQKNSTAELTAAFHHFHLARNTACLTELGKSLASYYYNNALFPDALTVCRAVEESVTPLPWWCGNRIGLIGLSTGNYDRALPYFQSALTSLESLPAPTDEDLENMASTLSNIGSIYHARGDYDSALKYLEQSLKIYRQIGDKSGEGTTLTNIGAIYHARGDYDSALEYFEETLKIFRQIGDKKNEGTTLNNIGRIYQDREDNDKALEYLVQALKIFRQTGDIYQEGVTCFNVARILEGAGEIEGAVRLVERTVEIDRFTGSPDLESDSLYLMQLKEKLGK